ncbi:MAG TPA: alkaline phosphatase family protein [Thermomicrobiales bacterium]|nr:alkaline phosphatase family protein [Thermomicrobiales bacterium]
MTAGRASHHPSTALVLGMVLSLLGALALPIPTTAKSADAALQLDTNTPIKHLVTVMQSNHSFDSLFGVYPGANGIPKGVCMEIDPENPDPATCVKPFATTNNGADFDHSHDTFLNQYNDGQNDGFLNAFRQRGEDGQLAMGHYTESDIPFSYNAAEEYVLFDHFFTSASAGSVANRMFWVTGTAGVTDYQDYAIPEKGWGDLPTIFDALEASGVSWKFYIENYDPARTFRDRGVGGSGTYAQVNWAPVLNFDRFLDDPALADNIVDLDQYFTDLENNELPAVSYVVTIGSSGHPPSSLLASERMLKQMVNALMMSDAWDTSVFQWAYDDWGGWYDHVPPPQVDDFGYGFRTPAQLISPYAKKGYIDSETHDFTSILKFIEDNWSLPPLSTRDANAISIATGLDFEQSPRPPALLSMSRETKALVIPKRSGIHLSYSIAIVSAGVVIAGSFLTDRLRKERRR